MSAYFNFVEMQKSVCIYTYNSLVTVVGMLSQDKESHINTEVSVRTKELFRNYLN